MPKYNFSIGVRGTNILHIGINECPDDCGKKRSECLGDVIKLLEKEKREAENQERLEAQECWLYHEGDKCRLRGEPVVLHYPDSADAWKEVCRYHNAKIFYRKEDAFNKAAEWYRQRYEALVARNGGGYIASSLAGTWSVHFATKVVAPSASGAGWMWKTYDGEERFNYNAKTFITREEAEAYINEIKESRK